MIKLLRRFIVMLPLLLGGCAITGPAFVPLEGVTATHGVVYVYRPDQLLNKGIKPGIILDAQEFAALPAGGYMPFTLPEGTHTFELLLSDRYTKRPPTRVAVTKDTPVYLRIESTTLSPGSLYSPRYFRLAPVPASVGAQEILGSKLIDPISGERYSKSIFIEN